MYRSRRALVAGAAVLVASARAWADPLLPTIPAANTFNIASFGASSLNTATQNFAAIQNAIGSCNLAGGGTVIVPAGTFVSLPGITVGNSTNFRIDGTLRAAPVASYGNHSTNFLTFSSAHDVELSGAGTLDGNATFSVNSSDTTAWWGSPTLGVAAQATRPRLLRINSCNKVEIANVHIVNSPSFHVSFSGSNSEITIDSATVTAPSNAPNTDAIDLTGTNGLVKNCNISVGDDNIVMKPQSTHCANFTVASCTFGSGHGVSIGGQTNAGMGTFIVTDCTFNGTSNGIHLKADRGDGGLVTNLTFQNLTMNNVTRPFDVSSYYINGGDVAGPLDTPHVASGQTLPEAPVLADLPKAFLSGSTPQWQNLTISNVQVNGSSTNTFFYGTPEALISNLTVNNLAFQNPPGKGLCFVNDADVHISGSTAAPIQCAVISSLEMVGPAASPPTFTQTFSSSLASTAVTVKNNASQYLNFDPNFDPGSVNTVRVSGNFALGNAAGLVGVYNLNGGSLAVGGVTTVSANSMLNYNAGTYITGSLQLLTAGKMILSSGANKVVRTTALSITGTSQLNLADNRMVIDYSGSPGTLADDVRQHLQANRITGSSTLGYGDNAILGFTTFGGVAVDATSLLIAPTFAGDSNLDGKVDVTDLGALATHWQQSGVWTDGDFNYDGFVDVSDLGALATNWQAGVSGSALAPSHLDEALAAVGLTSGTVPEPAGASLLLLISSLGRRRRIR
jgi:hypothetical protein